MQVAEHRIRSGDVELYLRDYGEKDAPVLVGLHGWPESSRGWAKVAPLLGDRFRVLVPDNRGFGRSGKPVGTDAYRMGRLIGDVAAILEWAGVPAAHLAGHDFGSVVTWAVCMFRPDLVQRAVTMAGPHPLRMKSAAGDLGQITRAAYTFLMNIGPGGEGERLLAARDFALLERFAFGSLEAISTEEREVYKEEWREPGAFTAMAEWYRAHYTPDLLNPDVALELPKTTVPIRYIHGTRDFAFVEALAETNAPFVAGSYDHVLIDTTHWMLHERPAEMAELIAGWLIAGEP